MELDGTARRFQIVLGAQVVGEASQRGAATKLLVGEQLVHGQVVQVALDARRTSTRSFPRCNRSMLAHKLGVQKHVSRTRPARKPT